MQNTLYKFDIKVSDFDRALEDVKQYLSRCDCQELSVDLSEMNIFDAAKFLVVSSALHYGKYPHGKIRCRCMSDEISDVIGGISMSNLELIR